VSAKRIHRRPIGQGTVREISNQQVFLRRDARTGRLIVNKIVSPTGVVVRSGPVTGQRKNFRLSGKKIGQKMSRKRLEALIEKIKIE
jgi:hypothetical protein